MLRASGRPALRQASGGRLRRRAACVHAAAAAGDEAVTCPRRAALLAALTLLPLATGVSGAEADEEAEALAAMRSVLAAQPALGGFSSYSAVLGDALLSFQLPATWTFAATRRGEEAGGWSYAAWDKVEDPVLGVLLDSVTLRTRPAPEGRASIGDWGAQANVLPATAFGLQEPLPELLRSDITRAGARRGATPLTGREGGGAGEGEAAEPLFYDWELAVAPPTCAYNTGCNSEALYFLSLTVQRGLLCVLSLRLSDETAYRAAASQLRAVRASLAVQERPPPVEAPPAEARGAPAAHPAVIAAAP